MNNAMMKTTRGMPGWMSPNTHPFTLVPHAAAIPMANSRMGSDIMTSTVRAISVSTHPPKNPATTPRMTPTVTEMLVASRATIIEVRAP